MEQPLVHVGWDGAHHRIGPVVSLHLAEDQVWDQTPAHLRPLRQERVADIIVQIPDAPIREEIERRIANRSNGGGSQLTLHLLLPGWPLALAFRIRHLSQPAADLYRVEASAPPAWLDGESGDGSINLSRLTG